MVLADHAGTDDADRGTVIAAHPGSVRLADAHAAEVVVGALRDRLRQVEVDRVHVLLDDHEQVPVPSSRSASVTDFDVGLAPGGSQLAPMADGLPEREAVAVGDLARWPGPSA